MLYQGPHYTQDQLQVPVHYGLTVCMEMVKVCLFVFFNLETFTWQPKCYFFTTPNAFCRLAITFKQESSAGNIVAVQETANRLKCHPNLTQGHFGPKTTLPN